MKQCRFGLDETHIDANLCSFIDEIANGGSWNEAARLTMRILFYQYQRQISSPERQDVYGDGTDTDINLDGLDQVFSELEE